MSLITDSAGTQYGVVQGRAVVKVLAHQNWRKFRGVEARKCWCYWLWRILG